MESGSRCADSFEEAASGPTCNSQVGVCLDLSRQIAGEALEHARVIRQETVDLQAAPDQHPVPGDLDRTDGRRVFVPHDIWLRCAWTKRRGLLFSPRRHRHHLCLLLHKHGGTEEKHTNKMKKYVWKGRQMKAITSRLAGDVHHLFHLCADVTRWLFGEQRVLCFQREER